MRIVFVLTFVVLLATLGDGVRADEEPGPGEGKDERSAPELMVQTGHTFFVLSVTFSPDGALVLTGSADRTARLWETATGNEVRRFEGHEGWVRCVSFSPDGALVLTGSHDSTVRLWETATGKEIRRLEGHTDRVNSATFSLDGALVLTGSSDRTVRLWKTATGKEVRRFKLHGAITSAVFSPDGRHVLTSQGTTAQLWETATGEQVRSFGIHADKVTSATFSPDGRHVLTGSFGEARAWETATGREVRRFQGHTGYVNSVAFSADGAFVLTGGSDKTARLWETATGKEVRQFKGHAGWVRCVSFSPDGALVLTGSHDQTVRLWDTASGTEVRNFDGSSRAVLAATFSPDGTFVLAGSHDQTARLWNTRTGMEVRRFEGHTKYVKTVAFSPDGAFVLTGGGDPTARLWETATGMEVRRFEGHGGAVTSATFSPDGAFALTGSSDRTARLWETATGREVRRFWRFRRQGEITSCAFSPDAALLLTGNTDHTVRLWETATGKEVRRLEGHRWFINSATFSPNGAFVLTGSNDQTARLWDAASGKEIRRFEGHDGWVNCVSFSPDGAFVLTGSHDQTVRLWETATGKEIRRFAGHTRPVTTATFSPDGMFVLTGSEDRTLRLWETASGTYLCSLVSFASGSIVVRPDGRFDASSLDRIEGLHWVLPDEPLRTYPIDIFLRDYYEPRLMARLLAGEALPKVRDLTSLNRVQPAVQIAKVEPMAEGASIQRVTVQVKDVARMLPGRKEATHSGAEDLRLFRDGRLVAWRDGPLELTDGNATLVFEDVPLWAEAGQKNVELSAYAFNVDRVKSETARMTVPLPADRPATPRTTYLIAMGVDVFDQPEWNLAYAAADAKALLETLGKRFEQVVPVLLTSEREGTRSATKKDLAAALAEVAKKAQPQDLVLITISTHGVSAQDGEFYLLPSDVAKRDDRGTWLTSCISAAELTTWLRPIDAEMVMVVDACQSAASVAKAGFKPGPMGSRGLGQLAYSKKMRILAASQAAEVALESGQIQHGLLTYALTTDGLEKGRADFEPKDGKVLLGEWLKYAERRVPSLAAEVHKGEVRAVARGGKVRREQTEPARLVQTPSLFDFAKRATDVVLTGK